MRAGTNPLPSCAKPAAPPSPPRLPTCIPIQSTDCSGTHFLSYPRSPFDPRLYSVMQLDDSRCANDYLACVDDFGDLVRVRRSPLGLFA